MKTDIVERLRSQSILGVWHPMMLEAADDIERQRKVISATIEDCQYLKDKQIEAADEIEKLRAALKPFNWSSFPVDWEKQPDDAIFTLHISVGHLRAAAAALKETGDE